MDWINDFTKNWKLKTAFILYMLSSLIFSMPISLLFKSILTEIRKKYIISKALQNIDGILDRLMYSDPFLKLIDFIAIFIILTFFYIFFLLFYRDKIKSVILFLDNNKTDLNDSNELSDKVFELVDENEKLKRENFKNIININELYKERDTIFHEIKNPLTTLGGDIEILNARLQLKDEKTLRILDRMARTEKRIRDYIININYSENIKTKKLDLSPICFGDFIKLIKDELNAWDKEINFSYDLKDLTKHIDIDSKMFLEAFVNILKNSDRHAKTEICINVFEDESHLIVEIEDDGPGFSKQALENFNKPYFSENPLVGNMGLGLYITDEIMKKLDIDMVLSNNLGANTKLFIKKL
ncbi:MAG: HAMP domain-containing sensor histidine kinase [Tissierellia bacterium]|nr:HAMP domain-containing sensor histidine kinase [Tissierellia bacterium]